MQMPGAIVGLLWLLQVSLLWSRVGCSFHSEEQLEALLATETLLIDELREYIERLDEQLEVIRRETAAIEAIHSQVGDGVEEYMGNPLNVLTLLKRFETDWPRLEQQANATHNISVVAGGHRTESELVLPTEEDYEEALTNLLHLQSVYELEPASLSLGMVNGMKLGSAMSWSDCLEMAMKADVGVAKFWLETALDRLPPATNATDHRSERERGKVQILEAALNMEYRAGELSQALATAEELLLLRPMNQNVRKAKAKIERALLLPSGKGGQKRKTKSKTKSPKPKSAEQLLIEELCRGATASQEATTGGRFTHCQLERSTPWSILQPARVELLSSDPYIALHHDVLTRKQSDELLELMDEEEEVGKGASHQPLKISLLAQKKLRRIPHRLGHVGGQTDLWEGRRHGHEHTTRPEEPVRGQCHQTRVMLNLQAPGMGGALVFPQLQLGVNVPRGALLHWRTRTTSADSEMDYRSRQAVCPVLLGVQVSAWTGLS